MRNDIDLDKRRAAAADQASPQLDDIAHRETWLQIPWYVNDRIDSSLRARLVWHVLPPQLPQMIALAGVSAAAALGATVPIEVVCDSPGIGQLAWRAALGRDLPLLVTLTLINAAAVLTANACADVCLHSLDRNRA